MKSCELTVGLRRRFGPIACECQESERDAYRRGVARCLQTGAGTGMGTGRDTGTDTGTGTGTGKGTGAETGAAKGGGNGDAGACGQGMGAWA